jgi:hypothetical protein
MASILRFLAIAVGMACMVESPLAGPVETAPLPPDKQTTIGLYLTAQQAFEKWQSAPDKVTVLDVRTPSAMAVNALAHAGFKNVYNITDGFEGDSVKDPGSVFKGQRMVSGWRNSGGISSRSTAIERRRLRPLLRGIPCQCRPASGPPTATRLAEVTLAGIC